MIGLTVQQHIRQPAPVREAVRVWANDVSIAGGIIEVHVKNEAGTVCDVLELDLNDEGKRYVSADGEHAQTAPWRHDVATPPFPLAALVAL